MPLKHTLEIFHTLQTEFMAATVGQFLLDDCAQSAMIFIEAIISILNISEFGK